MHATLFNTVSCATVERHAASDSANRRALPHADQETRVFPNSFQNSFYQAKLATKPNANIP